MRKFLFFLILLGLVGGVSWKIYVTANPQSKAMVRGKAPIAVVCEKTKLGDIEDVSEFTGTLAGKAEVLISPKISGRLKSVLVDLGDEAREGQLLAIIDDEEALHAVEEGKAKLAVARASLEECETNLATAQRELERVKTLRQKKVAADSELDAAESAVSALLARKRFSEANIQQQDAALRAAIARLSYTKITAPISGYVGKRFFDEGAMVSPSTSILQLADIRAVKTAIGVVERDYAKITLGLKATLRVDTYPERSFEGKVTRIAPILDINTRTAETEIEVVNEDLLLKPGMFTRVRILFGVHTGVVVIPSRAIVKRAGHQGVFVPSEDFKTARFVKIDLKLSNEEFTEVSGLEAGQTLIVMGQHLLNDGDGIVLNSPAK